MRAWIYVRRALRALGALYRILVPNLATGQNMHVCKHAPYIACRLFFVCVTQKSSSRQQSVPRYMSCRLPCICLRLPPQGGGPLGKCTPVVALLTSTVPSRCQVVILGPPCVPPAVVRWF